MQNSEESSEQAEALVALHIDGATINDANLSSLSPSELEQLTDLAAELQCIDDSNIEDSEEIEVKPQMLHDDIVETEIGEQEIEIETEDTDQPISPEEILPDFKEHSIKYEEEAPPPLRPLTIAPKPIKVPISMKNAVVGNSSGQQFFLIQSPGGTTNAINLAGQPIKLVSAQGQQLSIPNFQTMSVGNKSGGIVRLQTVGKTVVSSGANTQATETSMLTSKPTNVTVVKKTIPATNNKNIVAKVILGQQNQVVLTSQANESSAPQQIKLVSSSVGSSAIGSTAKTITLAQAQQMGLISASKVQQLAPQHAKQLILGKQAAALQQGKTQIKVLPQVKSPTKILPAPTLQKVPTTTAATTIKPTPQRVIIRQGGQLKTGTVLSSANLTQLNQIIRIPGSQGINPGQLHQINVPGKGIQYVRFMSSTSSANTTAGSSSVTTVSANTAGKSVAGKAQVVPVGNMGLTRGKTVGGAGSATAGAQNVIKVVPMNPAQTRPVAPKPLSVGQRLLIPATNSQTRPSQATIATIPASALGQLQGTLIPSSNNVSQIVMLPAQYVQQLQSQGSSTPLPTVSKQPTPKTSPQKTKISPIQTKETSANSLNTSLLSPMDSMGNNSSPEGNTSFTRNTNLLEPNGIRPRKPCNCTKSLCLKLYCDCFANGEFCHLCNCMNCYNNLGKEEERQRAIRNCLERNPNAFRPKIGKGRDIGDTSATRKHTKGCNCKRSGCLKNYCECYEAKIACSSNCKCIGCRNIEDSMEKKNVRPHQNANSSESGAGVQVVPSVKSVKMTGISQYDVVNFRPLIIGGTNKTPSNYMTNEVIEATNECLIAQADEAERNMMSEELAKKMILEEFGRCLIQIIECSATANTLNST